MGSLLEVTVVAYGCAVLAVLLVVVEVALPTFGTAGSMACAFAGAAWYGVDRGGQAWWPLPALALAGLLWAVAVLQGRPGGVFDRGGSVVFAAGSLLFGGLDGDVPTLAAAVVASGAAARLTGALARRVHQLRTTPPVAGVERYVGLRVPVERWAGGAGTVRIEGSLWNADGPSSMETARWARITAVRGLSASVVPWDRPEPSPADRHEPGNGNGPSNGASP